MCKGFQVRFSAVFQDCLQLEGCRNAKKNPLPFLKWRGVGYLVTTFWPKSDETFGKTPMRRVASLDDWLLSCFGCTLAIHPDLWRVNFARLVDVVQVILSCQIVGWKNNATLPCSSICFFNNKSHWALKLVNSSSGFCWVNFRRICLY